MRWRHWKNLLIADKPHLWHITWYYFFKCLFYNIKTTVINISNYSDKYFLVKRDRKTELWEINLILFSFCSLLSLEMEKSRNQNSSKALKITSPFNEKTVRHIVCHRLIQNFLLVMGNYRLNAGTFTPWRWDENSWAPMQMQNTSNWLLRSFISTVHKNTLQVVKTTVKCLFLCF